MDTTQLKAISPLDGRYAASLTALTSIASEWGLMRFRTIVEVRWLQHLANTPEILELSPLSAEETLFLEQILQSFDLTDAEKIKSIEQTTKHDVKAVEYFIRNLLSTHATLHRLIPFIHFACTSEDINNLAYALMLKEIREHLLAPQLSQLMTQLQQKAHTTATLPMLARTHGQPATPTTVGKELANFVARLRTPYESWIQSPATGKFNGAVGNYNAHYIAYPEVNWQKLCQSFVQSLGIQWNEYTTQIEPHDWIANWCHHLMRINSILIDCARDCWGYISLGYFTQRVVKDEVGSSTMPHKVNPIDFENAEGNLGIANALAGHFAEKLPISRWQRDLSDSTVLRNVGVMFGHCHLAYQALMKGLDKITPNTATLYNDLEANWEILSEAAQTVLRRYGVSDAYEQLKALTRGSHLNQEQWKQFIQAQSIPDEAKTRLLALTPESYLGKAVSLAQKI